MAPLEGILIALLGIAGAFGLSRRTYRMIALGVVVVGGVAYPRRSRPGWYWTFLVETVLSLLLLAFSAVLGIIGIVLALM
jgi:hypothetical protein